MKVRNSRFLKWPSGNEIQMGQAFPVCRQRGSNGPKREGAGRGKPQRDSGEELIFIYLCFHMISCRIKEGWEMDIHQFPFFAGASR
jgi:hypothetical protein